MDFLYRMPLVDFDPMDKEEIQKNWNWIKEAIQLSSSSLFQEIDKNEFYLLSHSTQTKIQKYLLRGRYRSTPFGLWAGVGLGMWGDSNQVELPLVYSPIEKEKQEDYKKHPKNNVKYRLAPGLKVYASQVHYWSYCIREEGWRISYLDKNSLIVILLSYFEKSTTLDFARYQNFFKSTNKNQLKTLWGMLLESGILIPEVFPAITLPLQGVGMDIKIQSKITLNHEIHTKLEKLISEIGNLFIPVESEFLRNFKSWFEHTYDDRFVPLTFLDHQKDFFSPVATYTAETQGLEYHSLEIHPFLWKNAEEFDLSNCFELKKTDLHQVQIAFKLIGETDIYIENIVCNRPFAYSGRFSLDPEIKNWAKETIEGIPSTAEYADIILFETSKSNHISRHDNVFEHSIYPFGKGIKKNHLGVDDLLIGIRNDRLVLYSQNLEKEILPIVQHPLNPDHISHTLSRLMWEIGNQDQQRFLPYHNHFFQQSNYTPRLTWKGIILQGRKWVINSSDFSTKGTLVVFLHESEIPCPIVAGHLDRELLLNWRCTLELDFLWEELNRMQEVTLFECPWKGQSPFKTTANQTLYPQLIYSKKISDRNYPKIDFLNKISFSDERWIYLRISVKEEGLFPLLVRPFPIIVRNIKTNFLLQRWYFLIYNAHLPEIRLRMLIDEAADKQSIESELAKTFMASGWVAKVDFSKYYPEFDKYGLADGSIEVSESIFHLESELVLLGNERHKIKPIITWDIKIRQNCIIETYFNLIDKCGRREEFLHFYKNLIKGIPIRLRKELNKSENLCTHSDNGIPLEFFETEFSKIAELSQEVLMRVIPNHLHMLCNRSFPCDTAINEQQVIYGLYKRLGKSIYGRLNSL